MACIELFHYLRNFFLTYDQWSEVYKRFAFELDKVHSKSEWTKATLKCAPSSIYRLPSDNEYIKCLGMSIGADLRCFLLTLHGPPEEATVCHQIFEIPKQLQISAEDDFFDYIVDCLCRFAQEHDVHKLFLPLGVTFNMPGFTEKDIEKTRAHLAKAFRQDGPERNQVNLLLTVSLTKNLALEICKLVLVNQASALLMLAIGLIDPFCKLVVTEYGAAYSASVENLDLLTAEQKRKGTQTIMELDWSEFADGDLLDDMLNKFDLLDSKKYVFEKIIAGKSRCETFQKILLHLIKDNVLFPSHVDRIKFMIILKKEACFKIEDLEIIEEDECPDFLCTKALAKRIFGIDDVSIDDCFKLRYLSQSLAKRASQMIAVILSSWINRRNESHIVVGLDERLFRLKERYTIIPDIMFMLVRPLLHYSIIRIGEDVGIAAAITAGISVNHRMKHV